MLSLSQTQLQQLHRQALTCYPEECCGLMLGQVNQEQGQGKVAELWSTENSWTPDFLGAAADSEFKLETRPDASRQNRFAIAPLDFLRAQKYARTKQLNIIGIYHSHPDYPAIPSEYDRKIAWACYSYVIMSVTIEGVTASRSWKLDGDRQFNEEKIFIED